MLVLEANADLCHSVGVKGHCPTSRQDAASEVVYSERVCVLVSPNEVCSALVITAFTSVTPGHTVSNMRGEKCDAFMVMVKRKQRTSGQRRRGLKWEMSGGY